MKKSSKAENKRVESALKAFCDLPKEERNRLYNEILPSVVNHACLPKDTVALLVERQRGDVHRRHDELQALAHRVSVLAHGGEIVADALHGAGVSYPDEDRTSGFLIELAEIVSEATKQLDEEVEVFGDFLRKEHPKQN